MHTILYHLISLPHQTPALRFVPIQSNIATSSCHESNYYRRWVNCRMTFPPPLWVERSNVACEWSDHPSNDWPCNVPDRSQQYLRTTPEAEQLALSAGQPSQRLLAWHRYVPKSLCIVACIISVHVVSLLTPGHVDRAPITSVFVVNCCDCSIHQSSIDSLKARIICEEILWCRPATGCNPGETPPLRTKRYL